MIGNLPGQNTSSSMAESLETESVDCAICLGAFTFDRPVTTTICNHTFHKTCLNTGFDYDERCPICRTTLVERVITRNRLVNNSSNLVVPMHREMTTQVLVETERALLSIGIDCPIGTASIFTDMTPEQRATAVASLLLQPEL